MKFQYGREADALIIVLREAPIAASDEVGPGLIADFGSNGEIVRLEILDASRKVDDLDHVDLASGRQVLATNLTLSIAHVTFSAH